MNKPDLSYDDVVLKPRYSTLRSRSEADTSVSISNGMGKTITLKVPVLSANMDTITEVATAKAMHEAGGLGCLHRYADVDVTLAWIKQLKEHNTPPCVSVGVGSGEVDKAKLYIEAGAQVVIVDIAHAHSIQMGEMLNKLHGLPNRKDFILIGGNVATKEAAVYLVDNGCDVIKVGIGPGIVCTTTNVTGHGRPQFTAVEECVNAVSALSYRKTVKVIADGGLRSSGDIVKALAVGADLVMVGGMLAGCDECPKDAQGHTVYRGMASAEAQLDHHRSVHNGAPEGVSKPVTPKGSIVKVMETIAGGIRSGMSYSGARTLNELVNKAEFTITTSNFNKK